jgi:hypothetical protein
MQPILVLCRGSESLLLMFIFPQSETNLPQAMLCSIPCLQKNNIWLNKTYTICSQRYIIQSLIQRKQHEKEQTLDTRTGDQEGGHDEWIISCVNLSKLRLVIWTSTTEFDPMKSLNDNSGNRYLSHIVINYKPKGSLQTNKNC